MSVSTQRAWIWLSCTHRSYQHVSHTFTSPWSRTPFTLFQPPLTQSAMVTSVSPVGMVTLSSPRQVTLARPNAHTGNMSVGVYSAYVCMSMLIWHLSKPRGTVPLPSHWRSVFFFHFFSVTLLIIFVNYLEHFHLNFDVATQESYSAKVYINIKLYNVRVGEFVHECPENVQGLDVDWFSGRLHNNRKRQPSALTQPLG